MPEATHNYTKLPGRLRDELGITTARGRGSRATHNGVTTRKTQRKAARLEKKKIPPKSPVVRVSKDSQHAVAKQSVGQRQASDLQHKPEPAPKPARKSILKLPKSHPVISPSPSPEPHLSRRQRERLGEDDDEIAALEKALGLKGQNKLPKSFEDDGLDDLLEGLNEATKVTSSKKRKANESEEWLERKRQKASAPQDRAQVKASIEEGKDGTSNELSDLSEEPNGSTTEQDHLEDTGSDSTTPEWDSLESDDQAAPSGTEEGSLSSSPPPMKAQRENPYVAPVSQSDAALQKKYIPPSVRVKDLSDIDVISRMRKQLQGLLNRLSEANLLSIVAEIERIYQNNPRQHVSTSILDLLLGLLADPSILQDTFIILHAGLIAAIYKVVGTEFGAQAIERIESVFSTIYDRHNHSKTVDKRLVNLINVFAELYNFQVIGSAFIFDLVHVFLEQISETNTELLLKIVRNAGTQLRQDDAGSLKKIASMLQTKINQAGEDSLSTRLRFMLETINHLKNRKMKTGIAASTISTEHTIRMKKTLGTLNQRSLITSEPLRFNLKDLQDTDKRGKWWLVGGAFRDNEQEHTVEQTPRHRGKQSVEELAPETDDVGDLARLAKAQRMNTDVRRSIFIAIMSATDYNDAYIRLMKLRLKKSQELEIPKVLIHCAGAETTYNPFYTLLSRRVCTDRKLKMAFQFSLWDIFKQMTDTEDALDAAIDEDAQGNGLSLRKTVNLARMFGGLIADGGLTLDLLKNLNLAYLENTMRTFVEIMLISAILQSQGTNDGLRNERSLLEIFERPKEMPAMARSLKYFLKKVVSTSDLAGSQRNTDCVRWACKVINAALTRMTEK